MRPKIVTVAIITLAAIFAGRTQVNSRSASVASVVPTNVPFATPMGQLAGLAASYDIVRSLKEADPQPTTVALPGSRPAVLPGLQITAALDKASYTFPDTIHLTITGTNTTNAPMVLTWASSCQVNYLFDGVLHEQACLAVNIEITIPAQSTHTWTISFDAVPVGDHIITGVILTYGMAAPLAVTIEGHRLDLMYIAK